MSALNLVATTLVAIGALIMLIALAPVRQLMTRLTSSPLRRRWSVMAALIGLFLVGYVTYAITFWSRHAELLDLIVPTIFLGGACFVWLSAHLSLQTAVDMLRVSRLEQEAITDALTGLFNRRHLDNRLLEELGRSHRYGFPLSVAFLDIDHFKHVNDRHGHPIGDVVLVAVARCLSGALRDTDVAARFGGEEFVVLMPQTNLQDATDVANRLIKAVEVHIFDLPITRTALRITCSAGVATLGEGQMDARALLAAADKNVYLAKEQGRNRVVGA